MADVVVNLETNNSEELVNQGIKAFNLSDFNTAVVALSKAVEILASEHGETHDSLGIAYFYYGKTLLELYREEIEPLGDAVPREIDSDSDDAPTETAEPKETKTDQDSSNKNSEATSKTDEDSSNKNSEATSDKPTENGVQEVTATKSDKGATTNGEGNAESTASAGEQDVSLADQTAEEEPTDLQVAWEVLELAKKIFEVRGESGRKKLADTFILLGEVSLESENFTSAIDDIKRGLEIQKTLVEEDCRTLAQTYYTLAVALSTNNEIDEAIKNFNTSLDILKTRINKLKENAEANNEEIEDINGLIPEIEEKIADMNNFKEETANRLLAAMQPKTKPETNGQSGGAGSSSAVNNISHLIKRKRKNDDDDTNNANPPKRASE